MVKYALCEAFSHLSVECRDITAMKLITVIHYNIHVILVTFSRSSKTIQLYSKMQRHVII